MNFAVPFGTASFCLVRPGVSQYRAWWHAQPCGIIGATQEADMPPLFLNAICLLALVGVLGLFARDVRRTLSKRAAFR